MDLPRDAIADFSRRWKVAEFSVFGSAARGDDRPDSDVDVLLRFQDGEDWDLLDLGRMKVELEDMLGRQVDIVEHGTIENPYRLKAIERDRAVVYAA